MNIPVVPSRHQDIRRLKTRWELDAECDKVAIKAQQKAIKPGKKKPRGQWMTVIDKHELVPSAGTWNRTLPLSPVMRPVERGVRVSEKRVEEMPLQGEFKCRPEHLRLSVGARRKPKKAS